LGLGLSLAITWQAVFVIQREHLVCSEMCCWDLR